MKEQKLTIRVTQEVLDGAKRYAHEHGTTLTRLVTAYLKRLGKDGHPPESAPITRGLIGVLPRDASVSEYREHLDQKYLGSGN